jgi:hypothetical protein
MLDPPLMFPVWSLTNDLLAENQKGGRQLLGLQRPRPADFRLGVDNPHNCSLAGKLLLDPKQVGEKNLLSSGGLFRKWNDSV